MNDDTPPEDAPDRRRRRDALRRQPRHMGIDRVHATREEDCWHLEVTFLPPWHGVQKRAVPERLTAGNLAIERGGERTAVEITAWEIDESEGVVYITLCGIEAGGGAGNGWRLRFVDVPDLYGGFDVAEIVFVEQRARRRPWQGPPPGSPGPAPPRIDYLALDYESFRRTIVDRIRQQVPTWRDASEADLGTVLAEILAYTADRLSYWRDAVATEAYLATARLPVSARRHARLLDYRPGEGCAPRTWVQFRVDDEGVELPAGTPLLTALSHQPTRVPVEVYADRNLARIFSEVEVFETVEHSTFFGSLDTLILDAGDESGARQLEAGATSASILGHVAALKAGGVLMLEEVENTDANDARHLIRIVSAPASSTDARGRTVTRIYWHPDDALPRAFPLRARRPDGRWAEHLTVARGNVALADFGRTIAGEVLAIVVEGTPYRPELISGSVVHAAPLDDRNDASAVERSRADARRAEPAIELRERLPFERTWTAPGEAPRWRPRADLLHSAPWSRDFVVEPGDPVTLRFGDGEHGRQPTPGASFVATYRIGDIRRASVAAGTIRHVVSDDGRILEVRNVLPVLRAALPESVAEIRLNAPQAHLVQKRCVTGADYERTCRSYPGVFDAAARLHHEGGHTRVLLYVQRDAAYRVDRPFRARIRRALEPCRMLGTSLHVRAPDYLPLIVELNVWVMASFMRDAVERAVERALLPPEPGEDREAFFAPGTFKFGEPVMAGRLTAVVMGVEGVADVTVTRFTAATEPDAGPPPEKITPGPHQIVRLDNDPERPENGSLRLHMRGGRK